MDLTALYELRERLRAGAIAGAALAADDFRLSRALEGLAPLEKASPVFAKIGALTRAVLAPDCPDRAGALLDAITLCDSVLCTQGAVTVPGELSSLPAGRKGRVYTNAPYSVVAPLVTALTTKGSGHLRLVEDTLETRSGVFQDYRVREALVTALGSSNTELAEHVQRYLMEQGDENILSLLMESLDPAGKKEMVRRVQIIDGIAGAKANDWYLEQLPKAKKAVRGALIYALRHVPENGPLLVELAQREKGDCKENALWALARTEAPEALPFWREQLDPARMTTTIQYLCYSSSSAATILTVEQFQRELDDCPADPGKPFLAEKEARLNWLFTALTRKSGKEVCELYRRAAAMGTALDESRVWRDQDGNPVNEQMFFRRQGNQANPFSYTLVEVLKQSIQSTADPMLCGLAWELYEKHKGLWAAPALTAALLTKGTEEAAELGKKLLAPGLMDKLTGKKEQKKILSIVCGGLMGLGDKLPAYTDNNWEPAVNAGVFRSGAKHRPIAAPLDLFWYDVLIENNMEQMLRALMNPKNPVVCQKIGAYFYRRISMGTLEMNLTAACLVLRDCGWTQWKGLLGGYTKHSSKPVSFWEARTLLCYTSLTNSEKADELHEVWTTGRYSGWPEKVVEKQLEEWWQS